MKFEKYPNFLAGDSSTNLQPTQSTWHITHVHTCQQQQQQQHIIISWNCHLSIEIPRGERMVRGRLCHQVKAKACPSRGCVGGESVVYDDERIASFYNQSQPARSTHLHTHPLLCATKHFKWCNINITMMSWM